MLWRADLSGAILFGTKLRDANRRAEVRESPGLPAGGGVGDSTSRFHVPVGSHRRNSSGVGIAAGLAALYRDSAEGEDFYAGRAASAGLPRPWLGRRLGGDALSRSLASAFTSASRLSFAVSFSLAAWLAA